MVFPAVQIRDKLRPVYTTFPEGNMPDQETYPIEIAGLKRDLSLFEVAPGLRIAILNILGDTELVQACAKELNKKLNDVDYDVLITAEAKSIPIAYALAVESEKPYVVLRKTYKPYMGDALKAETLSITTGQPQILILDEKDRDLLKDKKAVIIDDVISTGSTLDGVALEKPISTSLSSFLSSSTYSTARSSFATKSAIFWPRRSTSS